MIPEFFSIGLQILTVFGALAGSYAATRIHLQYILKNQKEHAEELANTKKDFVDHREDYIRFKALTEYQLKEIKK